MSVSRLAIREATGYRLDDLELLTAASGTATTAVVSALVSSTSAAPTTAHNGAHIYDRTTFLQRRVKANGFVPSTATLTLEPTGTAISAGNVLERTRLFPSAAGGPSHDTPYNTFIARGTSRLLVPAKITIPITASHSYSLATWSRWLKYPERLIRVSEPDALGYEPRDAAWRGWRLVLDAQSPRLVFNRPFESASGSITLDVLRPANSWVLTSGTWAESSTGMVLDLEEIEVELNAAVAATLVEVCEALLARQQGAPVGRWKEIHDAALVDLRALKAWDRTLYMEAAPTPAAVA